MTAEINPMVLGDIFDRTFKLVRPTIVRNLIIGAVFLIPASILLTIGLDVFFTSIGTLLQEGLSDPEALENPLLLLGGSLVIFFFFLLVYGLAAYAATMGATAVTCAEFSGEPLTWEEALRIVFSMRFLKAIGQSILQALAFIGILFLPYVMIIGGAASEVPLLSILGFLLLMVAIVIVIYVANRWAFTLQAVTWEDTGVVEALRRSWGLVKDNWWRVFGILLLFNIIVQFVLSLVLAPVYLVVFWGMISDFLQMAAMEGAPPDVDMLASVFESLGPRIMVLAFVSSLLTLLITPLYTSILYFDLRARAGDFRRRASAVPPPAAESSEPLPL